MSKNRFSIISSDVDDCASNPCQNRTTCTDLLADYNCSCSLGYTGKNCSRGKNHDPFFKNIILLAFWAEMDGIQIDQRLYYVDCF